METATACVIVRDEAPYLAEWLSHYLTLGFDRILVYDNGSVDNSAAIVAACARLQRKIHLMAWPSQPGRVPQISAYTHALAHADTTWIAYFDADELLVLNGLDSVGEFLARYGEDTGAIAINWRMFGSNGEKLYRDAPQASRFRLSGANDMIKSIVRVSHVDAIHVHGARLKRGGYYNDRVEPIELHDLSHAPYISYQCAQLNHYVLRSAEEFHDKRARGCAARVPGDNNYPKRDDDFWNRNERNNRQDDHAIDPWVLRSQPLRDQFDQLARALGPLRPGHGAGWLRRERPRAAAMTAQARSGTPRTQ